MNAVALEQLHREVIADAISLARWFDEHLYELNMGERNRYLARLRIYKHILDCWHCDDVPEMGAYLGELEAV